MAAVKLPLAPVPELSRPSDHQFDIYTAYSNILQDNQVAQPLRFPCIHSPYLLFSFLCL